MKTTELQMLWKLVKSGEVRPLSVADFCLLMRLRAALLDYEDETNLSHPAAERRCMICEKPSSECSC